MFSLPLLFQLTEYFEAEKASPGRVCQWISSYAIDCEEDDWAFDFDDETAENYEENNVYDNVLNYYEKKTGHNVSFFRKSQTNSSSVSDKQKEEFSRQKVIDNLARGLVGQNDAVEILADTVLKIRTHLNDLSRTAGAYMFVGPTGVGKTEAAKQLARVLYGSEEALIRYDANELTTPWSVAALLGNGQKEGSLTSAIRFRPNCVLLFDEIEKAHPDLADLLLQVLGEGRLTDGFGRVVSFNQCVVIFTSNLGTHEVEHSIGFEQDEQNRMATYVKAVRDYFRPEWLNRLDAIVPFKHLTILELKNIANRMINSLGTREGFRKRKIFFNMRSDAIDQLTRMVDDVRWGARGTIRMLEKELVTPAAEFLAQTEFDHVCIMELEERHGKIGFHAEELKRVKIDPLLEKYYAQINNQAMQTELSDALIAFLNECIERYSELYPLKYMHENTPERYLRFRFTEHCRRLLDDLSPEEKEGYTKIAQIKGFPLWKKIEGGDRRTWIKQNNLTIAEWDDFLNAFYHRTVNEILSKLDEVNRRPLRISLETFFDLFTVLGPCKKQREGAVLIQSPIGVFPKELIITPFFPGWLPPMEMDRGTTPMGHNWYSFIGTNAHYWMSSLGETEVLYYGDSPEGMLLRAIVPFDPQKTTPKEVALAWEQSAKRTWGPVTRITWLEKDCDNTLHSYPKEWIPQPILDVLNRHLSDDTTKIEKENNQ